jgi:hypothetical protein
MDERIDILLPLLLPDPSPAWATLTKDRWFLFHRAWPGSCFRSVAGPARSKKPFDAVDYGVNLIFNQTKWNDVFDQEN